MSTKCLTADLQASASNPAQNLPPDTPDTSDMPDAARSLADLSNEIIRNLTVSLHSASKSLRELMEDGGTTQERGKYQPILTLVGRTSSFLPLTKNVPDQPVPGSRFMPPCPICRAPAGRHFAHECPSMPQETWKKYVYDYRTKRVLSYRNFHEIPNLESGDYAHATIPRCGVCGKGPGAHWPDECPDNPIRDKMIGDRVVPPSAQKQNDPIWED